MWPQAAFIADRQRLLSRPVPPPPPCHSLKRSYAEVATRPPTPSAATSAKIAAVARALPDLPASKIAQVIKAASDRPPPPKRPKTTTKGPSRKQLIISLAESAPTTHKLSEITDVVNHGLIQEKSKIRATSTSLGYGGYVIALTDVPNAKDIATTTEWVHKALPAGTKVQVDKPASKSFLKVAGVPYYVDIGAAPLEKKTHPHISPESAKNSLLGSALKERINLVSDPRVVKTAPNSDTCWVYFDIWDSASGFNAKKLIGQTVVINGVPCRIQGANTHVGTPLCQKCWKWGHDQRFCRSTSNQCPLCNKPHLECHHRALAGCCKGNLKADPPVSPTSADAPCPHDPRCINCGKNHVSNDRKCIFWRNRWDGEWIKARYAKVRALRSFGVNISNLPQGKEVTV